MEDIIGGLRNAVARGEPLEKAMRSFINAGYNSEEVRKASELIDESSLKFVHPQGQKENSLPKEEIIAPIRQKEEKTERRSGKKTIVVLTVALLVLASALMFTIFFREEIVSFLLDLFSFLGLILRGSASTISLF